MGCPRIQSTSVSFRVLLGFFLASIFGGASLAADPISKGVVMISGGTSGIGLELVKKYVSQGYQVATFARDPQKVVRLKMLYPDSSQVYAEIFSISEEARLKNFVEHVNRDIGPIRILINNAGVSGEFLPIGDASAKAIAETIQTNLTGTIQLTSLVVDKMEKNHLGGVIINLSSGASKGVSGGATYAASKAGINAFSASVAQEYAHAGIHVYAFDPGHVATDIQARIRESDPQKFPMQAKMAKLSEENRLVLPENSAEQISYLADHTSSFKPGQMISYLDVEDQIQQARPRGAEPTIKDFFTAFGDFLLHEQLDPERVPVTSTPRGRLGKLIPSLSNYGNVEKKYLPSAQTIFDLDPLLVDEEGAKKLGMTVVDTQADRFKNIFKTEIRGKDYYRVFVHPLDREKTILRLKELGIESIKDRVQWFSTPSSSLRSMFVLNSNGEKMILKLTLHDIVFGGAPRVISREGVLKSVTVSRMLAEDRKAGLYHSGVAWDFFREDQGYASDLGGVIARSLPPDIEKTRAFPFLSLLSKNGGPGEKDLIESLFEKSGYTSRLEFVDDFFIKPVTEFFTETSFKSGISFQPHQQNLVYLLNPDPKVPPTVGIRDFDNLSIDIGLRKARGLSVPVVEPFSKAVKAYKLYAVANEHSHNFNKYIVEALIERGFPDFLTGSERGQLAASAEKLYLSRCSLINKDGVVFKTMAEQRRHFTALEKTYFKPLELAEIEGQRITERNSSPYKFFDALYYRVKTRSSETCKALFSIFRRDP